MSKKDPRSIIVKKLFLAAALLTMLLPGAALAEADTHVVILATSDMHGNIWS